ncbi:helix-hairpin-helix domain-containing protein [Shewanella sp. NIFS-20-20]|uniref:ComEA family DNA-binding protein n=1 Tax=Shewanella sp. NIFS-20-20 TaxID=2853806 RepID=UPI001C437654|nr:helix-hairpin-helix domain-containing protein [Shewanella sp. NIFS-20-20]MBV7315949.1 helix-hairpin-helix domain-containing protein [Shewanella sp. NIFS-20-20]
MKNILSIFTLLFVLLLQSSSVLAADTDNTKTKATTGEAKAALKAESQANKAEMKALKAESKAKLKSDKAEAKADNKALRADNKTAGQSMRININSASAKELAMLKGVGASKAQAIVDYRKQHGQFTSIDDLLKVKGIGPKIIDSNRNLLSL